MLTAKQRAVYAALCARARSAGACPTVRALSETLGLSVSNTHRYLCRLAEKGYVRLPDTNRRRVEIIMREDHGEI